MQERPRSLRRLRAARHTKAEKTNMLETIPWVMDLPYKQIKDLAYYLEGYKLRQGNILFNEGDSESYLVIIVTGGIDIIKMDSSQNPQLVAILKEGKVFGEMSLLDGEPRSAQAIAREDSIIYVLTKEKYDSMKTMEPVVALNIALKMAKFISQKLRQTTGQWVDLVNERR